MMNTKLALLFGCAMTAQAVDYMRYIYHGDENCSADASMVHSMPITGDYCYINDKAMDTSDWSKTQYEMISDGKLHSFSDKACTESISNSSITVDACVVLGGPYYVKYVEYVYPDDAEMYHMKYYSDAACTQPLGGLAPKESGTCQRGDAGDATAPVLVSFQWTCGATGNGTEVATMGASCDGEQKKTDIDSEICACNKCKGCSQDTWWRIECGDGCGDTTTSSSDEDTKTSSSDALRKAWTLFPLLLSIGFQS